MKIINRSGVIAMIVVVALAAGVFMLLPQQRREAMLLDTKIPARVWNFGEDTRLKYFTPSQTFSGTIEGISSSFSAFILSTSPASGFAILIDPPQQSLFRNQTIQTGDLVTVEVGTRISSDRKYRYQYLQSIRILPGTFRPPSSPRPSPDFSKRVGLFTRDQRQPVGLHSPSRPGVRQTNADLPHTSG